MWRKKLSDLKFELYLKKIEFLMFIDNLKTKWIIFTKCKKGIHEFGNAFLTIVKYSNGRKTVDIDVAWQECKHCRLMVFKNKKDLKSYLIHMIKKQKKMQKIIKEMEPRK